MNFELGMGRLRAAKIRGGMTTVPTVLPTSRASSNRDSTNDCRSELRSSPTRRRSKERALVFAARAASQASP